MNIGGTIIICAAIGWTALVAITALDDWRKVEIACIDSPNQVRKP